MKSDNTLLYTGIGVLAFVTIVSFAGKKNEGFQDVEPTPTPTPTPTPKPLPIVLNKKMLLKKGSTGPEVEQLQKWLGITADGIFGPITEGTLFDLKGVRQTTLENFPNFPNKNQNIIPKGSKIMANKPTVNLYLAKLAADGIFYKENDVYETVNFGELIGVVLGSTTLGNYYVLKREKWIGSVDVFVKASDVKKI